MKRFISCHVLWCSGIAGFVTIFPAHLDGCDLADQPNFPARNITQLGDHLSLERRYDNNNGRCRRCLGVQYFTEDYDQSASVLTQNGLKILQMSFFNITYSLVIAPLPAALDLQKEMQTIKIGLLNFQFFSKNASLR